MNLARLIFSENETENVIVEMIEQSRHQTSPERIAGEFSARKIINGVEFTDLESVLYYLADQGAEFDHEKALEIAQSAIDEIAETYLRKINDLEFQHIGQ